MPPQAYGQQAMTVGRMCRSRWPGTVPPHVDPAAAYGPPAAGDAWSDAGGRRRGAAGEQPAQPQYAQAGEWSQPHAYAEPHAYGQSQPQPQPYREPERTAAMPVVEAPVAAPRSGSPIIAPGIQPAALTAALGAADGRRRGGRQAGARGAPGALQAVTAAGWFRLNGMWPARQGIAAGLPRPA